MAIRAPLEGLRLLGWLPLLLPSPAPRSPDDASPLPPASDTVPSPPEEALRAAALVGSFRPPSVLYTWTTPEQIEELRASPAPRLLSRRTSLLYGETSFSLLLQQHAWDSGHPASVLLSRPGFARHRYAWHQPWATLQGWPGESYGGELLRVQLAEEAWVGLFTPGASEPWRFVDLQGRAVPLAEVLARPGRIGAVFYLKPEGSPSWAWMATFGWSWPGFREFVLCNEAMIARWEYGTPAVQAELQADIALLEDLAARLPRSLPASAPAWSTQTLERWQAGAPPRDLLEVYTDNLAFPNDLYLPTPENLQALLSALRAVDAGPPLVHRPAVPFSLEGED